MWGVVFTACVIFSFFVSKLARAPPDRMTKKLHMAAAILRRIESQVQAAKFTPYNNQGKKPLEYDCALFREIDI
jgi:hypothetical protein